jgi:hypothetical protein
LTSTGQYVLAIGELAAIGAAIGAGGLGLRRALLPAWAGAPARLAETVLALGLLLATMLVLGAVHLLDKAPLVIGAICVGIGAAAAARRLPAVTTVAVPPRLPASPVALAAAVVVVGLLVLRWAIGVEQSLHAGMLGFDTMWYHGPFAAGFAQTGSTTAIHFTGPYGPLVWFYPQSSELLHAGGMLLLGNDFLSPLVNLGWLGLALLAAWCIGRPIGAGPAVVVIAAIVLGSDPWLSSQPGEAYNDIAALALLLAAVAILVNGRAWQGGWRVLGVAGVAAGIAIGTKLTVAGPIAALSVGLIALSPAGTRRTVAAAWLSPILALGSFWYLRNLLLVGNPLPALHLGPLPSPELPPQRSDFSVAHYLFDGAAWRDFLLPGLHQALGIAWPAVLALAIGGGALALARGDRTIRLLAGVALVAGAVYLVTPYGAQGPAGHPRNFESNLRYAAPALILGMALLPWLAVGARRWRALLLGGLVVVFFIAAAPLEARHGPYLKAALALTALAVGLPFLANVLSRRRIGVRVIAIGLVGLALALAAGRHQESVYIEGRYRAPATAAAAQSLPAAFNWAREVRGARIATDAFRQYGLYGNRLSNRVAFLGREGPHGSFLAIRSCQEWRRAVNAGHYDYVVPAPTFRDAAGGTHAAPALRWTETDAAVRQLAGAGPVFEVEAPLSPALCAKSG